MIYKRLFSGNIVLHSLAGSPPHPFHPPSTAPAVAKQLMHQHGFSSQATAASSLWDLAHMLMTDAQAAVTAAAAAVTAAAAAAEAAAVAAADKADAERAQPKVAVPAGPAEPAGPPQGSKPATATAMPAATPSGKHTLKHTAVLICIGHFLQRLKLPQGFPCHAQSVRVFCHLQFSLSCQGLQAQCAYASMRHCRGWCRLR